MFDRHCEMPVLHIGSGQLVSAEQEHEQQLVSYASLKHSQGQFCDYILAAHPEKGKLIEKLRDCGSWLFFRTFETGEGDISRLAGGFTCKRHLFCICCATRRSGRYAKTYEKFVLYLLEQHPFLVPVLITYTVKDGPDLLERFEHLKKAQRFLLDRRRWVLSPKSTARGIDTILRYVHGGAGSFEVKIGTGSGEWHVHIHEIALLDAREFTFTEELVPVRKKHSEDVQRYKVVYVPQGFKDALRDEWFSLTKDSHQVDVRGLYPRGMYPKLSPLHSDASALSFSDHDQQDAIFSGLSEAFKYALKPGDMTHEQLYHAAECLTGRRLVYSYGSFYNVEIPDDSFDDIEEDLRAFPYYERIYRFSDGEKPFYDLHEINRGDDIRLKLPSDNYREKNRKKFFSSLRKKASAFDHELKAKVKIFAEKYRQSKIVPF